MRTLPKRFRLALRLGRLSKSARPLFAAFGTEIELDTKRLLALAPLRHGGAPYTDGTAIKKETMQWVGWLTVHRSGPLKGRLLVNAAPHGRGNSGRNAEFSSGLGECIALAIMTSILKHHISTIIRIPEDKEGMDFRTSNAGGTAIEAKAGHGSCLTKKKREIAVQMRRQKIASEKYGCVLQYERAHSSRLNTNGSSVYVYDPPGAISNDVSVDNILMHYMQITQAIGFWVVSDALRSYLELPKRDGAMDPFDMERILRKLAVFSLSGKYGTDERRSSLVRLSHLGPGPAFTVGELPYLARLFDLSMSSKKRMRGTAFSLILLGISLDIVQALARFLLAPSSATSGFLMQVALGESNSAVRSFSVDGENGHHPACYCGLEDGVIRVDLDTFTQAQDLDFSIPLT